MAIARRCSNHVTGAQRSGLFPYWNPLDVGDGPCNRTAESHNTPPFLLFFSIDTYYYCSEERDVGGALTLESGVVLGCVERTVPRLRYVCEG